MPLIKVCYKVVHTPSVHTHTRTRLYVARVTLGSRTRPISWSLCTTHRREHVRSRFSTILVCTDWLQYCRHQIDTWRSLPRDTVLSQFIRSRNAIHMLLVAEPPQSATGWPKMAWLPSRTSKASDIMLPSFSYNLSDQRKQQKQNFS